MNDTGGPAYVFAEGTMSGTVRGTGSYTIPVQIHYPTSGGNGTAVLELTNEALMYFHLEARGDIAGDRLSDADDIDELEAMLVNLGWAGARDYLLRNGYTHMAIQYSKMVTDFMGEAPPDGRTRRHLCYGRIERASDAYQIIRDAARWLSDPSAMDGGAPEVPAHDHVVAYGLSGTGYLLRDYLMRGENAGGEIDGFFLHAAGSQCSAMIDNTADCPEGSMCLGSPRFSNYFTCPGPPPTNGAKVLAVDAQTDLEFNLGALAREKAVDDPDYVRWEVAGAPHVPVFAMDLTHLGAPHQNPMDWSPIWRSAFHYLDRWVKQGTPPPAAPPIEGSIVATESGSAWRPALDADGNALGGIRLPPIEVPTGVYTGFDFSWLDPAVSKGHEFASVLGYGGRFEPFSDETLAERYPTEADYKKAFEAAARRAFDAGYILEEDLRRYTAAPMPVVASDVASDEFEDQYFDSGGLRIRFIDVGPRDAQPVVLVHGFTQRIESAWGETGVIDALDDDYRVIALDCRGHGKSDTPHDPDAYGPELAADVVRLLDHLRIEKAHVVGYSMGGRVTFKVVADYPHRLLSAMPCGAGWGPPSEEVARVHRDVADSLVKSGSIRPILEKLSVDDAGIEQIDEQIRATNDTLALAAVHRAYEGLRPKRAKLEANPMPCLSVVGADDPLRAEIESMLEYMPHLEMQLLEGHNHMTAIRAPEFIVAIKAFLARHAAAARDRFFDSDGVRIRFIDVGRRDGECIVLVTPPAQSIEDAWVTTGILDVLDDEYRVIGVDPRGQGKSDKPHDPAAYGNAWVEDIVRLLNYLRIDRAHLAGYSGSGRTVFKFVADHPDRVISALPCGTSAEPLTPEGKALFERLAASLEQSGSMRPVFEHFNVDGTLTEAQIEQAVGTVRANNDTKALAAAAHTVQELIPERTRLERNAVPCLCVIGAADPNLAPARETATYMPGLEIHVIEGADHLTAFRRPEFRDAITSFIAAHRRGK